MILEMAPLEGLTTYIYRNAFARHFGGMDVYYTPFLSLHKEKEFNHKERQEILPEHNAGLRVIPQVLTNSVEDFLRAEEKLAALGYDEININIGCPSGTVTAKHKGAGLLADRERLRGFLDGVFERTSVKVSVKTRLGLTRHEEWQQILEIYNQYALSELIVHARVREDFYNNEPDWDAFAYAISESRNPLCYNGDIFSVQDYVRFRERFPEQERVMLGRGLLRNPFLPEALRGENGAKETDGGRKRLKQFHDEIYNGYRGIMEGDRNVLFRMKELWFYMAATFPEEEKQMKKIRKCNTCAEYESHVERLFLN